MAAATSMAPHQDQGATTHLVQQQHGGFWDDGEHYNTNRVEEPAAAAAATPSTATPTSHWPGAGIFVKVEFGVAFSPTSRTHRAGFGYASKNMAAYQVNRSHTIARQPTREEIVNRSHTTARRSPREEIVSRSHTSARQPPRDEIGGPLSSHPLIVVPTVDGEERRPGRRRIRSRSAMQMPTSRSPVSPISPPLFPNNNGHHQPHHSHSSGTPSADVRGRDSHTSTDSPFLMQSPTVAQFPSHTAFTYPSPPGASSSRQPRPVRQNTIDRKPLPPLPVRFRLGEDLPWSSPTLVGGSPASQASSMALGIMSAEEAAAAAEASSSSSSIASRGRRSDRSRVSNAGTIEDPERNRELASLQTAMMTVDSNLGEDSRWQAAETPRSALRNWEGPGGVGWAVRLEDQMEEFARERLRGRERREQGGTGISRVEYAGWYEPVSYGGGAYTQSQALGTTLWSPPPAYDSNRPANMARGTWGWEWEWEDRAGYWVRADLRRSFSQ